MALEAATVTVKSSVGQTDSKAHPRLMSGRAENRAISLKEHLFWRELIFDYEMLMYRCWHNCQDKN